MKSSIKLVAGLAWLGLNDTVTHCFRSLYSKNIRSSRGEAC